MNLLIMAESSYKLDLSLYLESPYVGDDEISLNNRKVIKKGK